jgi:acetolactate synthase small subunit
MKQELSIEAGISQGDGLLAQVVQALRLLPQPPESLIWSAMPNTGEARIWMIVAGDDTKLRELVSDLGRIPGVRRVFLHCPGQAIKEALVRPNSSQ